MQTKWFTKNSDSLFYKADTLKFIKYSNYGTDLSSKKDYAEDGVNFYNGSDLVTLEFQKNSKAALLNISVDNWEVSNVVGNWSWNFDKKDNLINIYFKDRLRYTFKPLREVTVKVKSVFANQESLNTTELTLIRIKP